MSEKVAVNPPADRSALLSTIENLSSYQFDTIQQVSLLHSSHSSSKIDLPRLMLVPSTMTSQATVSEQDSRNQQTGHFSFGGPNILNDPKLNSDLQYDFSGEDTQEIVLQPKRQRSSSKKARSSNAKGKKSLKTQRDDTIPTKLVEKPPKKKAPNTNRSKPPPAPQIQGLRQKISIIDELDEEQQETATQPPRKHKAAPLASLEPSTEKDDFFMDTVPNSSFAESEFKLPRLNLSSQFNSLAVQTLDKMATPEPELIFVKPVSKLTQAKSLQSATTQYDTQRGDTQRSASEQHQKHMVIKEFSLVDEVGSVQLESSPGAAEKEQLATKFYCTRVAQNCVTRWFDIARKNKFEAEILEAQTEQAESLHNALSLQKALKALNQNTLNAKSAKLILTRLLRRKERMLKIKAFLRLKKGSDFMKAETHHQIKLICKSLRSLCQHTHVQQLKRNLTLRYHQQLLFKVFAALHSHRSSRFKQQLEAKSAHKHWSGQLVRSTFKCWKQASREVQVARRHSHQLVYKCFNELQRYAAAQRKHREHTQLVLCFYRCQIAKKVLNSLFDHQQHRLNSRITSFAKLKQRRLGVVFVRWRRVVSASRLEKCADVRVARVARIWLDGCFGALMAKVWRDFPRQKHSNALLLNYLCLAKRARYRQFFADVNTQLRQRVCRIVFEKLRVVCQKQRKFKVNFVMRHLQLTFRKFAQQCQRQCYIRQVRQHFAQRQITATRCRVVSVLKQHKELKQEVTAKQQRLKQLHLQNLRSVSFLEWRHLLNKRIVQRQQSLLAHKIYKTKQISHFLKAWLRSLQSKLTKKHLAHTLRQHHSHKRGSVFLHWRRVYLYRRLRHEEFCQAQASQKLQQLKRVFEALKDYACAKKLSNFKHRVSSQQYTYWLGRRVFCSFVLHLHKKQAKKKLLHQLASNLRLSHKKKCFQTLRSYLDYKQARNSRDHTQQKAVQNLVRRVVFEKWSRVFYKRKAVKMLAHHFVSCQKRSGFARVLDSSEEVGRVKLKLQFKKQHRVFRAWQGYCLRQKHIARLFQSVASAKLCKMLRKLHNVCHKQKQTRVKVYSFQRSRQQSVKCQTLHALQQNVLENKAKRLQIKSQVLDLKHAVYTALHSNIKNQKQLRLRLTHLTSNSKSNLLHACYKLWRQQFYQQTHLHSLEKQWKLKLQEKVFAKLRKYTSHKVLLKLLRVQFMRRNQTKQAQKTLQHLSVLAQSKKQQHQNYQKACDRYICALKLKAVSSLRLTPLSKLKRLWSCKAAVAQKKRCLQLWFAKAQPRVNKVRACHRMALVAQRQSLRKAYTNWRDEARYLSSLCRRVKVYQARKVRQEACEVLRYLRLQLLNSQQQQRRAGEVSLKLETTLKSKVFGQLTKHTHSKHHSRQLNNKARLYRKSKLRQITFGSLITFTQRQLKLKSCKVSQKSQHNFLSVFFARWQAQYQLALFHAQLCEIACQKRQESLQQLALRKLCAYAVLKQKQKQVQVQVQQMYQAKVMAKVLRSLHETVETQKDLKIKRQVMSQTLACVASEVSCREAFAALRHLLNDKHLKNEEAAQVYASKLLFKTIDKLKEYTLQRQTLNSCFGFISAARKQQVLKKTMQKWHLLLLQHKAESHAQKQYWEKTLVKCFGKLKKYSVDKKSHKYARTQRSVVVAVKVMESLKSYVKDKRLKKELSIRAYQHLSKKLQYKSLKAFCIHLSRQSLIVDFQTQSLQRLTLRCLTAWDRLLQLKLTRANAFANCYALLMKRHLYTWRAALQDQSEYESCQKYRQSKQRKAVFRAWQRTVKLNKIKAVLEKRTEQTLQKDTFKKWRKQSSHRLNGLMKALKPAVERQLKFAFDQTFNFGDHQAWIHHKQRLSRPQPSKSFNLWLHQDLVKQHLTVLAHKYAQNQLQAAINTWRKFTVAEQLDDQRVAQIQSRLSEKQFFAWQAALIGKTDMAHLRKAVFTSWRDLVGLFKKQNYLRQVHSEHAEVSKLRQMQKFLDLWINSYKVKRHKNCLKVYVEQQYYDKLARKVFDAILANALQGKQRAKRVALVHRLELQQRRALKTLKLWNRLTHYRQNIYRTVQTMDRNRRYTVMKSVVEILQAYAYGKQKQRVLTGQVVELRAKQTKLRVLKLLRDNTFTVKEKRQFKQVAEAQRARQMALKTFASLRQNVIVSRHENSYSRQFAVFTAWKSLIREQKLLSQYLSECNYQK